MRPCCLNRCYPKKIDYHDLQAQIDYLADTVLTLAVSDHREAEIRRRQLKQFRYDLGVRLYELEKTSSLRYQELIQEIGNAIAQYKSELEIIISDLNAEITQREILAVKVNENTALIEEERRARADAYSAEVTARERLAAQISVDIAAAIESEATARANSLEAEALTRQRLMAQMSEDINASITSESIARATGLEAEATTRQAQIAQMNSDITASITREATARVNYDEAEAERREEMRAQLSTTINAAITEEARVRANADEAEAEARRALSAQIADNTAAITNEAIIRATADSAEATARAQLEAKIGEDISAAISNEAYARVTADEAEARRREELAVQLGNNTAAIAEERQARITENEISLSDKRVLEARIESLAEGIMYNSTTEHGERTVRRRAIARATEELTAEIENANRASAGYRLELLAIIDDNEAKYEKKIEAVATDLDAEVTARETLEATVSNNYSDTTAAIEEEKRVRASADTAEATARETLTATMTTELANESQARIDGDNSTLGTVRTELAAAIETERTARVKADEAEASARTTLSSTLTKKIDDETTERKAAITSEATTRANADSANASAISTLQSTVGDSTKGLVKRVTAVETSLDGKASASDLTTLGIEVKGNRSYITSLQEVQQDLIARSYIKLDNNGYITGLEMYNGGYKNNQINLYTDKFVIRSPNNETGVPPFSFDSETGTLLLQGIQVRNAVIGDEAISEAKIKSGSVSTDKIVDLAVGTAKINNLAVTTTKIADANITTAKIADAAITTAKIQDATITSAKIADAAITNAKIANLSVDTAKIKDLSVGTIKIADNAVSNASSGYSDTVTVSLNNSSWTKITSIALTSLSSAPVVFNACVRMLAGSPISGDYLILELVQGTAQGVNVISYKQFLFPSSYYVNPWYDMTGISNFNLDGTFTYTLFGRIYTPATTAATTVKTYGAKLFGFTLKK